MNERILQLTKMTPEEIAAIPPDEWNQIISETADELLPIIKNIIDAVVPIIAQITETVSESWAALLKSYPDKRIVWLAFHHKKERIRKKNRHRILKELERKLKYG